MKLMILILGLFGLSILSGCKQEAGNSSTTVADAPPVSVVVDTPPVDGGAGNNPTPQMVNLTASSLSRSEAPVNGWPTKTYIATGTCTQYNSKVYCWDDGIKTLEWTFNNFHYGPFTYSYWGRQIGTTGTNVSCHGACTNDYMETPRYVDVTLEGYLTAVALNDVFTNGVTSSLNCIMNGTVLTCGALTIEPGN